MSQPSDWFDVKVDIVAEKQKPTVSNDDFIKLIEQLKSDAITKEYVLEGYSLTDAQKSEVNAL